MVRKLNIEHGKRNIEHRTPKFEVGAFGLAEYRTPNTEHRISKWVRSAWDSAECLAYPAISAFDIRCSIFFLLLATHPINPKTIRYTRINEYFFAGFYIGYNIIVVVFIKRIIANLMQIVSPKI